MGKRRGKEYNQPYEGTKKEPTKELKQLKERQTKELNDAYNQLNNY